MKADKRKKDIAGKIKQLNKSYTTLPQGGLLYVAEKNKGN